MGIKEDLIDAEKEIKKIKKESLAMEMVRESQEKIKPLEKANKRMFVLIIIILVLWFATIGYLVYVLNDINTIENDKIIDINEVETIDKSNIHIVVVIPNGKNNIKNKN